MLSASTFGSWRDGLRRGASTRPGARAPSRVRPWRRRKGRRATRRQKPAPERRIQSLSRARKPPHLSGSDSHFEIVDTPKSWKLAIGLDGEGFTMGRRGGKWGAGGAISDVQSLEPVREVPTGRAPPPRDRASLRAGLARPGTGGWRAAAGRSARGALGAWALSPSRRGSRLRSALSLPAVEWSMARQHIRTPGIRQG